MKDNQKPSVFPTNDYVRPNLNWECGHLRKGCPCRIGPSPSGKCRATFECEPALNLKPGEKKGHWTCTRPRTAGGKCENGPLPDGTCCNAIPKCQPRRTLRSLRKRVTAFTIVATCLLLFMGMDRSLREEFINPGPISSAHDSEHFADLQEASSGDAGNCAACHDSAGQNSDLWYSKVIDASRNGLVPAALIKAGPIEVSPMDQKCLACHAGNDFHQPNMVGEFACHACHKEHETSGPMPPVNSSYCTSCHASAKLMAESREKGAGIDPHEFPSFATNAASKLHLRERPEGGYAQVISAFHVDHPEFQLIRDQVRDENSLKFNHALHLQTGEIPEFRGERLNCNHCHKPDARGEYLQPITYEQQCADCHALQFDAKTPQLHLPHGDPEYIRAFLRSYAAQYEQHARNQEGITLRAELDQYVIRKEQGLFKQYGTGEDLERAIFFADMKGRIPGGGQAAFAGCATCHHLENKELARSSADEWKVSVTDRWMVLGRFDHEAHNDMSCVECHHVLKSELTSDLNLPSIKSCVECHSPEGGVDNSCTKCHSYHNSRP